MCWIGHVGLLASCIKGCSRTTVWGAEHVIARTPATETSVTTQPATNNPVQEILSPVRALPYAKIQINLLLFLISPQSTSIHAREPTTRDLCKGVLIFEPKESRHSLV